MKNIFLSIKNFFASSKDKKVSRDDADDYTVNKSRGFDIAIRIISIVGAVIVWLSAVTSDSAIHERTISSVKIEQKNYAEFVSAAEDYGFMVNSEPGTIDITVKGRKKFVNSLTEDEISVYADYETIIEKLKDLDSSKEQSVILDVDIKVPAYFMVTGVSGGRIAIMLSPLPIDEAS